MEIFIILINYDSAKININFNFGLLFTLHGVKNRIVYEFTCMFY